MMNINQNSTDFSIFEKADLNGSFSWADEGHGGVGGFPWTKKTGAVTAVV